MKKRTFFLAVGVVIILALGRNLNPFDSVSFMGHDSTQAARVQQFLVNLSHGVIPPRLAPDFSFGLGFPVFTFYAPAAYWITSFIAFFGFSIPSALEVSYLLALIVAYGTSFLFLRSYFSFWASIVGAVAYVTVPYVAVEIFVRGNIAEMWFYALFPLSLFLLTQTDYPKPPQFMLFPKNRERRSVFSPVVTIWEYIAEPAHHTNRWRTVLTVVVLFLVFTVHNILSLFSLLLLSTFVLLNTQRFVNGILIGLALLLSAYFLVPAVTELSLTHATTVATMTEYQDHFLCLWQVWDGPWGYAGSAEGCTADGMAFKLGKLHILLALAGMMLFAFNVSRKKERPLVTHHGLWVVVLLLSSLFLTTYASRFIWDAFSAFFSLFQFPWRFLIFCVLGIAFFTAYALEGVFSHNMRIQTWVRSVLSRFSSPQVMKVAEKVITTRVFTVVSVGVFITIAAKYFFHPPLDIVAYEEKYLSPAFISQEVVYSVPEYLPRSVDYEYWLSLKTDTQNQPQTGELVQKGSPFDFTDEPAHDQESVVVPVHWFPNWRITVGGEDINPESFDSLGRPVLPPEVHGGEEVTVRYVQTWVQRVSTGVTVGMVVVLVWYGRFGLLWRKQGES